MTTTATAPPTEPTASQKQAIKDLLRRQPSLADDGPLHLLYSRHWAQQASWLCAFARAAGLEATLAPVSASAANPAGPASAFERRLRQATAAGATAFALADLRLDLPPGSVQLAGTLDASPLDLWQPDAELEALTRAAAKATPASQSLKTGSTAVLDLTVSTRGWQPDAGQRANGQARVSPAGALLADVAQATGTFVADGAIALNRPVRWDARLTANPVTLTVTGGVVTQVACDAPDLRHLLTRAIEVHQANVISKARIGLNHRAPAFSPDQGPVNDCHAGVTLTLSVDPSAAYSPASADLLIELTSSCEPGSDRSDQARTQPWT